MKPASRVAIVTGAARGIGLAIVEALAATGTRCVIADVDEDQAAAAAERVRATGARCIAVTTDVSDEPQVEALMAHVGTEFGPTDVLVNNAGISLPAPVEQTPLQDWERVMAVNLRAAYLCSKHAFPGMKRTGWGRIVNIASFAGKRATLFGNNASYSASKAGVIGLTRALALEGAGHGVTVNGVAPGIVETTLLAALTTDQRERLTGMVPVGRLAQPAEIASLVRYLVSDEAAYVTGEVVNINGGLYMD
jgi:NAD(P)-dependent dehydrogenase (short-subunit alcohol dehydrogenase family)